MEFCQTSHGNKLPNIDFTESHCLKHHQNTDGSKDIITMTSSPSPSTENQCSDLVTDATNLSKNKDISSEHIEDDEDEEEDEEGDMDFNPFLKEPPSREASSSLSSDIEEFHADVASVQNPESLPTKENEPNTVTDIIRDDLATSASQKPIHDSDDDDEDAIWRRTRARYSLVGSTLDELETFLQETDDEDDLHNIDDEQEYRKFLAAVLQDGDLNSGAIPETENIDEDEDNDADFELELEEALGSDDENPQIISQKRETRQKKRQKTDFHKKKYSNQNNNSYINRPLRPILPYAPPYTIQNMSSTTNTYFSPFTPHQIGQLHCLIYEHVQLLVQAFSCCVLEPSRTHIAPQVQKMILDMVNKRDQVLAYKRVPYPSCCFSLPYIQSTVNYSLPYNACESDEGSFSWVPFVSEHVFSVIDVAPLNLVGSYLDDVSHAVQEYHRREVEVTYDANNVEKECLFPFGNLNPSSVDELDYNTVSSRSNNDPKLKKTIAGELVEKSMKQSVALVPKEISSLALRFFPLFNPALFPHKPPPFSVANRVLFTDAEDCLLARGLMEYNTDWKEIQKNFLPCKNPHQIFVRQKNRACSRAPENPIKAVRRMKNSPLTLHEKARIEEGLRVYKLDWMSVWKYMVPHRDPTLLARQYRTAVGNQKSYKVDDSKKLKRRMYESQRRRSKGDGSRFQSTGQSREGWSTEEDANPSFSRDKENTENAPGEINSDDDDRNNEDEAYVHEAFLSDWRPENQPVPFPQDKLPNYSRLPYHSQNPIPTKISRPEFHFQPFQARSRSKNSRVVKLAPDLPPVNLPPTVRIMSQSAFTKYNESSSGKAGPITPLTHPRTSQPDEQNSGKGDSDLQMHPLLFQDSEDGSLPYYPLNPSVGSSSSFDFFPNNLNLFRYSHQEKHTVNFFNNLKSKELNSSGVEFHPLLQRTDDGIGDSGVAIPEPVAESETPRRRVPPRSPNELDLDIRLSSSVRNRDSGTVETGESSELPEGNGIGRDSGVGNDEIVMEQEELSDSEDEEVAESVEFECEEMTDSEGEGGSDSDHAENIQNEEVENDVLGKGIDEGRCEETSKSDVAIEEPTSLLGLSLNQNPKLRSSRSSLNANRSSKNTTLPTPPQVKKPRKRAQKLDPR